MRKECRVLSSTCGVLKPGALPTSYGYARWASAHTTILKNLFLAGKGGGVCEDCDARGAGEL